MVYCCLLGAPFTGPPLNHSLSPSPLPPPACLVCSSSMVCVSRRDGLWFLCVCVCEVAAHAQCCLSVTAQAQCKSWLNAWASILSTYTNRCERTLYSSSLSQNQTAALAPTWTTCSVRAGTLACSSSPVKISACVILDVPASRACCNAIYVFVLKTAVRALNRVDSAVRLFVLLSLALAVCANVNAVCFHH